MRQLLCIIGIHKWNFTSIIIPKHKREIPKDIIKSFVFGKSEYYEYICECCSTTQWYVERYNALNGYIKKKIKI